MEPGDEAKHVLIFNPLLWAEGYCNLSVVCLSHLILLFKLK